MGIAGSSGLFVCLNWVVYSVTYIGIYVLVIKCLSMKCLASGSL